MNPLFKNNAVKGNSQQGFINRLKQIDNNFLNKMQAEARKRGISETDIQNGLQLIRQLQR